MMNLYLWKINFHSSRRALYENTWASCPNLWCLLAVPPKGEDIFPWHYICWHLDFVNNAEVEVIFGWIADMNSKSFQSWSWRWELCSLPTIWIFIQGTSPTPSTSWYWILCPFWSSWKSSFVCPVCSELFSIVLILSILDPLLVSSKLERCFFESILLSEILFLLQEVCKADRNTHHRDWQ